MTSYFGGGALGSWLGAEMWSLGGWPAVTALGAALSVVAILALVVAKPLPAAMTTMIASPREPDGSAPP